MVGLDTKGQLSDGFAEDVTESFLKEEKRGVAGAWGMFNLLTDLIPDYAMATIIWEKDKWQMAFILREWSI